MKKSNNKETQLSENHNVWINEPNAPYNERVPEVNSYYLKISKIFATAKIFCIGLFCFFILLVLFFFGEAFTYENTRYILRDIEQILSDDSSVPAKEIALQADGNMDFEIFKGNIVVAGESNVKILSPSGNEKLSDDEFFTSPQIVSSDKYCIVYSLGAYNLSVYNSVARVYDMKFDFPIYSVAVSDNGYIAVMTQSREYKCTVYLYNSDFVHCATYNKSYYPSAVEISSDGKQIFISSFSAYEGDYTAQISAYTLNTEETLYTYTYDGSLPLEARLMSGGYLVSMYEDALVFLDETGNAIAEYNYVSSVFSAHFTGEYVTIIEGEKNKSVHIYNSNGENVSTTSYSNLISSYTFDGVTFIQRTNELSWQGENKTGANSLKNATPVILYSRGYIFACYIDEINTFKVE